MTGTSPPGPLRCGSTTWSVNAVATAASNALPPRSKIPMPTAVAIQWVEVTTPNVPSISGRVVKVLGLMLVMNDLGVLVMVLRQLVLRQLASSTGAAPAVLRRARPPPRDFIVPGGAGGCQSRGAAWRVNR